MSTYQEISEIRFRLLTVIFLSLDKRKRITSFWLFRRWQRKRTDKQGINDESALDKLYDAYIENDSLNLLHEEFDYMIEDLREQGQIKDLPNVQTEKDNLVNIVGNIVGKVDVVERENKNGETFKVANFSVVSKDDEGNKVYHNCSAYGEKSDIPKDFK